MSEASRRRIIVAGATGLVGTELVALLAKRDDVDAIALVRSPKPGRFPERVHEVVFDYESDESYATLTSDRPDVLFCCLGTTRGKAGSDDAFRRVDRDYPLRLLDAMKSVEPKPVFALVSSVGADSPRGLYLTTKAEVESSVTASGLPYVIVRPSFLTGDRAELRVGERIGLATVAPVLSGLGSLFEGLKRYSPISAREVARALVHLALERERGPHIVQGEALFAAAKR